MKAYFDTAVFDHLYRKIGCGSADIAALRKAIYGREVSVRLSPHNLEEILLARKASPQAHSAQLRQMLSIASLRSLLKPCEDLLIGDVRAYAANGAADNPFLHGAIQNVYSSGIAELIESDGEEFSDEFIEALEDVRRQRADLIALLGRLLVRLKAEREASAGHPSTLTALWQAHAVVVAEQLADQAGVLTRCRARGISGLLEVPAVRTAIAFVLAGLSEERSADSIGKVAYLDGVHHALNAAVTDGTFVAADDSLRTALASLIGAGLAPGTEVIDLVALLNRVAAR
ncbi:MAG: hypothetical protein ABSG46_11235 [Candidatus Binataceae bacterium]|jgi:hypothetical protein